jgi:hypothetical protein
MYEESMLVKLQDSEKPLTPKLQPKAHQKFDPELSENRQNI